MTELAEQISNFNADHPLSLLFDRCCTLAARAGDGSRPFIEAVDMAADWAGLVDRYGDDVVQLVLAAAFAGAKCTAWSN